MTLTAVLSGAAFTRLHHEIADAVARLRARRKAAAQRRAVFNRTRSELNSLTDSELIDLGIVRADIYAIAREEAAKV